ncbi:hypothetical protein JXR01_00640 [Candidatus Kaiserbacteria bacterium]|nr:MAG: hypothetical protein JXR01_00640 [Candidatus Kaiserbacteria bacterium]
MTNDFDDIVLDPSIKIPREVAHVMRKLPSRKSVPCSSTERVLWTPELAKEALQITCP